MKKAQKISQKVREKKKKKKKGKSIYLGIRRSLWYEYEAPKVMFSWDKWVKVMLFLNLGYQRGNMAKLL